MSTLENQPIKDTYKKLLQVSGSTNAGATAALKTIETGDGVSTVLQVSTSKVKVAGDLEVTGSVAGLSDGADGADGVSVTGATVNSSGQLVLSLSSGSTINAGVVKGTDGTNGTNGSDGAAAPTITNATITDANHLELTMSDGATIDAGVVISNVTSPANLPGIYASNQQIRLSDDSMINQVAIGSRALYTDWEGYGIQTSPDGNFYPEPTLFIEGGAVTYLTSFHNNSYPGVYNRTIINYQEWPDGTVNERGFYGNRPDGGSTIAKEMPNGRSIYPLPYLRDLFEVRDFYYYTDTYTVAQGSTPSDGSDSYRRRFATTHEFEQKWELDTAGGKPNQDPDNDDGGRRGQYLFEQNFYFAQYPLEVNESPISGFVFGTWRNVGLFWDAGHPFRERNISPNQISAIASGSNMYRWTNIYSNASVTVVSDERTKQDIAPLDEAELATAKACKGLIRKFRMRDAVDKKGDKARTHIGVIAQDVIQAFEANGLDPFKYGIVCTSKFYQYWEHTFGEKESVKSKDKPEPIEEAGQNQRIQEKRSEVDPEIEGVEEQVQYSVRYEELLAFIISAL